MQQRQQQQRVNALSGATGPQGQPPRKPVKPGIGAGKAFFLGLVASFLMSLLVLGALIFYSNARAQNDRTEFDQLVLAAEQRLQATDSEVTYSPANDVRQKALAPNVNIAVEKIVDGKSSISYGSGVMFSSQGDVITNNHVIDNANLIEVSIGGTTYKATVSGQDKRTDLAVLHVTSNNPQFTPAELGNSADVKTGDYTIAVGNPYGYNDTYTTGIVSATGRNLSFQNGTVTTMFSDMIQTSAPISAGSSGGGLYNENGQLIGINTLIITEDSYAEHLGYAIPVDQVVSIAQQLKDSQSGEHPSLGIVVDNVPDEVVEEFGLESDEGAYIRTIAQSSPAQSAGLKEGDIIISYGGNDVTDAEDLLYKIRASVINENVDLVIIRQGREMQLTVRVGSDA